MVTKTLLAFLLCLLAVAAPAATIITAQVTITNAAGTTNAMSLTINGDTRYWTNAVYSPTTQILAATNATLAAKNLLLHLNAHPFTGLSLRTLPDGTSPVIVLSNNWGTVTLSTNALGSAIVITRPFDAAAVAAIQVAVEQVTVTNLYPVSGGTNFWLDLNFREYLLTATNDVYLMLSTNWPTTNATRAAGIKFKGDTVDHGLTWNTNWILLGITNQSLVIPSNKVARAAFQINGIGETNVIWGWVRQR